jgi:hypothetical protein
LANSLRRHPSFAPCRELLDVLVRKYIRSHDVDARFGTYTHQAGERTPG